MKTSVRKTIQYKQVIITGGHATLQDMLTSVLVAPAETSKAAKRREQINQDDDSFRVINHNKIHSGMFFGQLIFLEPGKSKGLITIDDDAEFYNIEAITPSSLSNIGGADMQDTMKKQKQKEFIESLLYFGVFDNHLVMVQSQALRSQDLETHFAWLLGTRTNILGKGSSLILSDKPTEETIRKIEKHPVKSIVLGAPVQVVGEPEAEKLHIAEQQTSSQTKKIKWTPQGKASDIIGAVMGANWFDTLKLEDSLDEANLQVNLEITYIRKTTKYGQQILDNIATALRHVDDSDVSIVLNGGGTIKGDALKLSGHITVQLMNGWVDENNLYHQMHAWLVSKIQNNEVDITENAMKAK